MSLKINEIFHSIQGESSRAGWPCVFVRLTYCNLRCDYCDTVYSYEEGEEMELDDIIFKVNSYRCKLVEITGGEPLVQKETPELAKRFLDLGYIVLIETSGSLDIGVLPDGCIRIVDFKTPSCGMAEKNLWENVSKLKNSDEVKFVVRTHADYQWAVEKIAEYNLLDTCPVSVSPVFGELENETLANWILADKLPLRLNLQIHKYIWAPETRGV
ncbi:radical SAM protein [Gemmatimonas aurantiaca]|nr:radical SAM protein [Gemmatimonas aurantiaca]